MPDTIGCPHCGAPITYGRDELYTSAKSAIKQCQSSSCRQWARVELKGEDVRTVKCAAPAVRP